jgi:hypothetical protein
MSTIESFSKKYGLGVLAVLWLIIQYFLYSHYGFVTGFEGAKYYLNAKEFIAGAPINRVIIFYYAYPILIAVFLKLGLSLKAMLILQLLASAWATYRFYCLGRLLFPKIWIAVLSTSILILTIQIQQWNFFLYTESLFTSGIIIYTYRLFRTDFLKISDYIILGLMFIFLSFLRPNGILLLFPTIAYLLYSKKRIKNSVIVFPLLFSIVLMIGLNVVLSSGDFYNYFVKSLNHHWIIWGYNGLGITETTSHSFWEIMKLFLYRMIYFFSMQRPYYSFGHNLLMTTFYPVYLLSLFGFISFRKKYKAAFIYSLVMIIGFFALTILLFVNWHGRFIVPILPFFILLSGFGIAYISKKIKA